MAQSCIFCKIISQEIPVNFIAQNNDVVVIQDIAPKAPVHYLIIPKKHIHDINALQPSDADIAGKIIMMAQHISTHRLSSAAFRLIANNGPEVGQSVFHLHFHFLSGKKMADF